MTDKPEGGNMSKQMLPRGTSSLPRRPQLPGTTAASDSGNATHHRGVNMGSVVTEPKIVCTECGTEIKLTESLAAPLVAEARRRFEQQLAAREAEFGHREAELRHAQHEIAREREAIDEQVAARLRAERARIAEEEADRARQAVADELGSRDRELEELREIIAMNQEKIGVAQAAHAETLRKARELDEAQRELDLTVEKKVQQELAAVRQKAKSEADEILRAKLAEREAQIGGMQRQIEDLRRKAAQGSQQLQGEAQEIELESMLRARFPGDVIEPVPKGEFGGDVLHRVLGPAGQTCGTILFEAKRTKNWTDGWLAKLRGDQRAAGADVAMIVSSALPQNVQTFDFVENVWVVAPRFAIPLAIAIRQSLVEVATTRVAQESQRSRAEQVYQYLTGLRFRHRVEGIVERFSEMQADLDRERKAMTKMWAKREEQLRGVLNATAGLYGDLQGIAGHAVPEIESLNLLAIEAPPGSEE